MNKYLLYVAVLACTIGILGLDALTNEFNFYSLYSYRLLKVAIRTFLEAILFGSLIWVLFTYIFKALHDVISYHRSASTGTFDDDDLLEMLHLATPQMPTERGDHAEEFFDIPYFEPVLEPEDESRSNRRRRPRMACTLNTNEHNESGSRRRNDILESLIKTEFTTCLDSQLRSDEIEVLSSDDEAKSFDCFNVNEILMIPQPLVETQEEKCPNDSSSFYPGEDSVIQVKGEKLEDQFDPVVTTRLVDEMSFPKDIILHQFPRGFNKPCCSCDGMYLETYIRLIGISCDVAFDCMDTNGPWICCEQKKIFGVKCCIEFLKEKCSDKSIIFTVNGDRYANAWSISLLIDHLYWRLKWWRWVIESAEEFITNQPGWETICKNSNESMNSVKCKLSARGFGKMSYKELTDTINHDFLSLSVILSDEKPFFLGESPTEIDCQAFSVLSQIIWGHECFLREKIKDYPTLQDFCLRMKNMMWPDWESQLAINMNKNPSVQPKITINDLNLRFEEPELDQNNENYMQRDFTRSFYMLSPDVEPNNCDCDENLLYICIRCNTRKIPQIRPINDSNLQSLNAIPEIINKEGNSTFVVEEYFDDNFEDMERISTSSRNNV